MEKDEFKKGIDHLKDIQLDEEDKNRILNLILDTPVVSPYAPEQSLWLALVNRKYIARVWMVLLVLVLAGGVTFYKAESALPGEKLYALKVGFSEPARDIINITPENKAEWESIKAVRRLDEATDLSVKGELNEKNRNDLEARFNKHTDAFDSSIANKASSTPKTDLIKLEFEANVSARAKVLENLSLESDENDNNSNKKSKENGEENHKELKKLEKSVSEKLKERKEKEDFNKKSQSRDKNRN